MRMVNAINKDSFGGTRAITCNTCHRGDQRPKPVPSLTIQHSAPEEDPNDIDSFPASGMPSADGDDTSPRHMVRTCHKRSSKCARTTRISQSVNGTAWYATAWSLP